MKTREFVWLNMARDSREHTVGKTNLGLDTGRVIELLN